MRCLIVGGAGFVGGHVADALMKEGHDVVLADIQQPKWHPGTMFRNVSVIVKDELLQAFDGVQVVFHLAAVSNTQVAATSPAFATANTCLGTANVLEAAKEVGVERVVVAGSTLVSGLLQPHEMEWPRECYTPVTVDGRAGEEVDPWLDDWVTDEQSPAMVSRSKHPYVTTKLFQEMSALDMAAQGLPVTVLRYGIMYGQRMTPGVVVHTFIERAMRGDPLILHGDGQQWRQYMHVSDLVAAHVAVLEHWDESENEVFNVCPERKTTIADIAEAVCQVFPKTSVEYGPAREGDVEVRFCLASKAKQGLGWMPKVELQEGIEKTAEWYRNHQASGMRRRQRF